MMIRVNPDQLTQAGQQFRQAGEEARRAEAAIDAQINGLMLEWEGPGAQQWFQEFQQWRQLNQKLGEILDGVGQQLVLLADTYRHAGHA